MKRSKDAFKRVATLGGQMSDIVFCREVLGDGVPAGIANVSPELLIFIMFALYFEWKCET